MGTPTKTTQQSWITAPGQDFLQLSIEGGGPVGWIDSTGASQGSLGVLQTAQVLVSSAQLKALPGTPVVLLPAPGINQVIVVNSYIFQYRFVAPAYTLGNADNTFTLVYHGHPAQQIGSFVGVAGAAGLVDQIVNGVLVGPGATPAVIQANASGLSVDLTMGGTTPGLTLGNGSLVVTILYSILILL